MPLFCREACKFHYQSISYQFNLYQNSRGILTRNNIMSPGSQHHMALFWAIAQTWCYVACRTGVIFCVFQANRGESEASAWRARVACEGRSAKKSRLSPYHCSSRSGVQIWTRLPNWLLWNTWSSNVFPRRNTITYSDLNTTDRFALKLFGEFNWKYGPMGLICSL